MERDSHGFGMAGMANHDSFGKIHGITYCLEPPTIWNHRLFGRYIIKFGITYYSFLIIFVSFSLPHLPSNCGHPILSSTEKREGLEERMRHQAQGFSAKEVALRLLAEGVGRPRWMIISNDHKAQQMYMEVGVGLLKVSFPISD